MTTSKNWTGLFLVLALVALLMGGVAVAQDAKLQDPKVEAKIFEGALTDMDPNAKVFTVKSGDKEMQFSYNEQTELVAPQSKDGKPTVVAQGAKTRVHYVEREKINIATKIEIIEATAAR